MSQQGWRPSESIISTGTLRLCAFGLLAAACFAACPALAQEAAAPDPATLVGNAALPRDLTPWGMFHAADAVVKSVLISLVFASIITWTIALAKTLELMGARRSARKGLAILHGSASLRDALEDLARPRGAALVFASAASEELRLSASGSSMSGIKERTASALHRLELALARKANRGTGFLATIGAIAPFVGLFGTVWGIMNSFIGISQAHTTNLAVVAPGIAEALLATAFGLAAAIPAVVIYNFFSRALSAYRAELGDASAEVQRLVSRDLDRHSANSGYRSAASTLAAE
jgi:biopolymer transport protein ExbB